MSTAQGLPLPAPVLAGLAESAVTAPVAPALEAVDISFAYGRGAPALDGVSLTVPEGAICMILGPSGSGKSTFLKIVKGQLVPQRGTIALFGTRPADGAACTRRPPACRVASIPQSLGLVRSLTAFENTLTGALGRTGTLSSLLKLFSPADVQEARERLDSLGIGRKADEKVYNLSGGERQRVAIARALMQRARLVLADEFVSQLDLMTTRDILEIVRAIARTGVTFLVTSHEIELVAEYGDRAVFLRDGRKVHECPAAAVDRLSAARAMGR